MILRHSRFFNAAFLLLFAYFATQRLTQLADFCSGLHPATFYVHGRARCRRGRKPAYFLPVDLSTAAEEVVEELQKLSFLDRTKVKFHVSVGRQEVPEIQAWDGTMDQLTVLKLDGKKTRNFVESWDFRFGVDADPLEKKLRHVAPPRGAPHLMVAEDPDVESVPAAETAAVESDEAEASPLLLPQRGRIRPRRTVFQRLSQVNRCHWKVGDRVLVRDRDEKDRGDVSRPSEDDWNPGIVTSLHPVKVRLKGGQESFTWKEIKELPKSRSASASPSSTWSTKFLPASAEVLRRARKLSRRRRKREKEAERKEMELWARAQRIQCAKLRNAGSLPNAAKHQEEKQAKVRNLRLALEQLLPGLDEVEAKETSRPARRATSPGRARAARPFGPSISALKVLKLSKDLKEWGKTNTSRDSFHLKHLQLLTVQDKKDVLKKLSHPRPEQAVQEDAFFAWINQQLQHIRMYCSSGELPQVATASTSAMSILNALRVCIDKSAPNEDDSQSLERFVEELQQKNLRLEHLERLPQGELKRLVEKLGTKMTGMTKEETIQKLKTELWSSRTKSSAVRSSHAGLFRYEPAEAIASVRRLLKKAEEERDTRSMTVWELHQWLGQYNARVKDLSCLLPAELRQLTSWLKMPPLRSKEDILEWLQREVWREQTLR
ncbi:unnamed protein product [Cladocopium goreaui]|nr:unnamed protein product [Cladocopium goreaui]